jgi:hypothetical protein
MSPALSIRRFEPDDHHAGQRALARMAFVIGNNRESMHTVCQPCRIDISDSGVAIDARLL